MALGSSRELEHFAKPPESYRPKEELATSTADIVSPKGGFEAMRIVAVDASSHIYAGGFLGLTSAGVLRPLVAGDQFVGVSYEDREGSESSAMCKMWSQGDFVHALTGVVAADVGRPVFASADDTLTFSGLGNSYVGTVRAATATDTAIVRIDPDSRPVKSIVSLVEDLLVGIDIAARAFHCFLETAWIVGVRVLNQTTAAAGIDADNTAIVAVANPAGAVASKTFNDTAPFPAGNAAASLGAITHPQCAAGDVLTLAVTQGVTADLGSFVLEVHYV